MASQNPSSTTWYVVVADALFLGGTIFLRGEFILESEILLKLQPMLGGILEELSELQKQAA